MKSIRSKAAFLLASGVLLTACGGGGTGTTAEGGTTVVEEDTVVVEGDRSLLKVPDADLPDYVPIELVEPDFPSVAGSPAGFQTIPELVQGIETPRGTGGTYTVLSPLWGTIPSTVNNQYFDAVNAAMGTDIEWQISDGNAYGEKITTLLAAGIDNLPDWIVIPAWNTPPRFDEGVGHLFTDLTPYLSGDNIEKYPFLANIPTNAWQACQWNGRLYGLPRTDNFAIGNWIGYRADIIGEDPTLPTNADELLQFAVDNTEGNTYGTEDLIYAAFNMFGVIPENPGWTVDADGNAISRYETPEYLAALQWVRDLYASGAMHPDAIAGQGDAGQRFDAGDSLMVATGASWNESLARMRAIDPNFDIGIMPFFAADGENPVLWENLGVSVCSYIRAGHTDEQVEEMLNVANFVAAPFGTEEWFLIHYGVEGVHYNFDADGIPVMTELGQTEVQPSYEFLVAGPKVNAYVTMPDYVENLAEWNETTFPYLQEPTFFGMRINAPQEYQGATIPFNDLQNDFIRGRADEADFEQALELFRNSGGDELRAFYQNIYDTQGG